MTRKSLFIGCPVASSLPLSFRRYLPPRPAFPPVDFLFWQISLPFLRTKRALPYNTNALITGLELRTTHLGSYLCVKVVLVIVSHGFACVVLVSCLRCACVVLALCLRCACVVLALHKISVTTRLCH